MNSESLKFMKDPKSVTLGAVNKRIDNSLHKANSAN